MPNPAARIAVVSIALFYCGSAAALEYCVSCEGPAAMYRCVVEGTPEGQGTDSSNSLYCISQMAAKGQHQSCSVARGAPYPCPGFSVVLATPQSPPMTPAPPAVTTAPEMPPPPQEKAKPEPPIKPAPAEAQPGAVPRTVEELAGQTVKSSKEGIEKAGEAIGGTAKTAGQHITNAGSAIGDAASKTWTCISSFFSSCGDSEEASAPPVNDAPQN